MEKLQQALKKARAERAQSVAAPRAAAPGTAQPADGLDPTLEELWAEIQPLDPDASLLRRNRVVTYDSGRESAAFDILRTKVILQMRKNGWRRLAITSPTAACGKSTVTCNLALGMSRQSDLRTIAVELDLHNPSMARILGRTPDQDVTEMIEGDVSFAEQAFRVRDNVAISLASRPTSDPTRHLLSQATEDHLAEIEEIYAPDLMLFDVPPLLVSDDTRAFLSKVDCALLVARAEQTTIGQIDTSEREIAEQTNVLGVVLNQARFLSGEEGGYDYAYRADKG